MPIQSTAHSTIGWPAPNNTMPRALRLRSHLFVTGSYAIMLPIGGVAFALLFGTWPFGFPLAALSRRRSGSDFGLRISDFFRHSSFVILNSFVSRPFNSSSPPHRGSAANWLPSCRQPDQRGQHRWE